MIFIEQTDFVLVSFKPFKEFWSCHMIFKNKAKILSQWKMEIWTCSVVLYLLFVVVKLWSIFLSWIRGGLKPRLWNLKNLWPLNPTLVQISFREYFRGSCVFRRFCCTFFPLLSVCVCKLGQRKLLCAANDLINWLWWLMTYILPRVSLSFEREIDVPCSAPSPPSQTPIPPSIPPCSLPGLSAESGWSAGRDPKYLAPPRLPQGTLGGGLRGRQT